MGRKRIHITDAQKRTARRKAVRKWYQNNRDSALRYGAEWKARNKQRIREYGLMKKFGISTEDFQAMHDQQNGLCAICGEEKKLQVDHCHKTGRVRGLLCGECNKMIGLARDDMTILWQALGYLNLSSSSTSASIQSPESAAGQHCESGPPR